MSLFSDKKIAGLRYMTCQSSKNPLGQVNLQKINLSAYSIFVTEGLLKYIYFLLFEENHPIGFPELKKKFLQRFGSFFVK